MTRATVPVVVVAKVPYARSFDQGIEELEESMRPESTSTPRTDPPKPAPFPVGARVRYEGSSQIADAAGNWLLNSGMEFDVVDVTAGRQGTGRTASTRTVTTV